MEKSKSSWAWILVMLVFIFGLLSLAGTKASENWLSLLASLCGLVGMFLILILLAHGKLNDSPTIIFLGILFIFPMYLAHFMVISNGKKFIVVDGKIIDGFSWKIPFVSKVVEVDKNVFAEYDCFAVSVVENPNSFIQGHFWTACEVKVIDKEKFLQFVANEKNPNKKILGKANEFLAKLIKESELSTINPFSDTKENFHDV